MGNCIGSRLKRNKSPPRYEELNDEKFDSLDDVPDLVSSDSEDGPEQDTIRVFSYDATAFFQHDGEIFAADRNNNLVQLVTLADIWKAVDSEFGEELCASDASSVSLSIDQRTTTLKSSSSEANV